VSISATFAIPSRVGAIEDARRWVTGHLQPGGASADALWEIELAMTEALANVIKHAYGGDGSQRIDLALLVEDDRVEIEIVDSGAPFNPASYVPPDLEVASDRGYGVHLIDELMDEVDRQPAGDRGTRLRLVKQGWRNRQ